MINILVAGGAGYIGSHVVRKLIEADYRPIIFDNLSTGHIESVPDEAIFFRGDVRNKEDIRRVFIENEIQAVMHFCAKSIVGESMEKPEIYFENNVLGGLNLLNVMKEFRVGKIIFSSTAAVYGEPEKIPICEEDRKYPTNAYGESKLIFEQILKWYNNIHNIRHVALRYFNAAGADDESVIGEDHFPETHLVPIIFQVVNGSRSHLSIFGDDYETKDGTCVRDYVHVYDLASAHILALEYLIDGGESDVFNLGSGDGYSVNDIVSTTEEVINDKLNLEFAQRREGDPAVLIASSEKIKNKLGWEPVYNLKSIIETAYKWHQTHPDGYGE